MYPEAPDDPLVSMRVESVEGPDGRYLVYYSWPPEPEPPADERIAPSTEHDV